MLKRVQRCPECRKLHLEWAKFMYNKRSRLCPGVLDERARCGVPLERRQQRCPECRVIEHARNMRRCKAAWYERNRDRELIKMRERRRRAATV